MQYITKYVTTEIMGGLGNQLFQIYTMISYSLDNKVPYFIFNDTLTHGPRKTTYWNSLLNSLTPFMKSNSTNLPVYREQGHHYEELPQFHLINKPFKLFGYFQSYKYFEHNKFNINKILRLDKLKLKLREKFQINYENTISLHFRLGDYKSLVDFHPVLDTEYYIKSLVDLKKRTNREWNVLYFCEDEDIEFVNKQIEIIKQNNEFSQFTFTKIDNSLEDWEQMLIMSLCQHNIIANSTFSWWGAYLNENNNTVYYPEKWFGPKLQDKSTATICPDTWIKIV